MIRINGHRAMTSHELGRQLLEEPNNAVVMVLAEGSQYTIYKMESSADGDSSFLYGGNIVTWPYTRTEICDVLRETDQ